MLTQVRGIFFKWTKMADLKQTYEIRCLSYGETFPRLLVLSRERRIIIPISRYSGSDRLHILEALRPLLENPSVKKDKTTEWALKAYFKKT
jgi:hypothetical protein